MNKSNFKQLKHDVNGNPRFVTSWLGYGFKTYAEAVEAANKIGGRRYHNKSFGGGIVFQAYECELDGISKALENLAAIPEGVIYIQTKAGGHNTLEANEDFRRASDATNARWRAAVNDELETIDTAIKEEK